MTLGKSSRHLSMALFASIMSACGSETPAFQEKGMSALMQEQRNVGDTFSTESFDQSADATASWDESADVSASWEEEAIATASMEESLDAVDVVDEDVIETQTLPESFLENIETQDLSVEVKDSQLRFGSQTTTISTSVAGERTDEVEYKVLAPEGKDPGKIINGNTYVSPSTGSEAYEVQIIAVSKDDPTQSSSTVLKLEPATQVFAGCTNDLKGFPIKAEVYSIPAESERLPDFSQFNKSVTTACMEAFQIPNRAWSDGFPGQPQLIEWFALRASSHLSVTRSGKHYFKLNADDGAKLYIDGKLVVDNDGQHAEKAVVGSINLSAGQHEIVVEYFQGPRYHIALELFWKTPGSSTYTYVPASAFKP